MKIKITRQGLAGDGKSAYYSDHTTPLPIGEWDVKLKHQVIGCSWYDVDLAVYNRMDQRYRRQIYLSPLPPAQPVKAVEEEKCIVCDESTANKSFCADCGLNKADDIQPSPKNIDSSVDIVCAAKNAAKVQDKKLPFETSRPIDNFMNGFFIGAEWKEDNIKATHVPVEDVEKLKIVLKQIRRVELLTPETEALINKILNP